MVCRGARSGRNVSRSVRPEVGSSHRLPRPAGAHLVEVCQEQYLSGMEGEQHPVAWQMLHRRHNGL